MLSCFWHSQFSFIEGLSAEGHRTLALDLHIALSLDAHDIVATPSMASRQIPRTTRSVIIQKQASAKKPMYHDAVIAEREIPALQRGEVLVRMSAAAYNHREVSFSAMSSNSLYGARWLTRHHHSIGKGRVSPGSRRSRRVGLRVMQAFTLGSTSGPPSARTGQVNFRITVLFVHYHILALRRRRRCTRPKGHADSAARLPDTNAWLEVRSRGA